MVGSQAQRFEEAADLLHSASIHVLRRAVEADEAAGLSRARLSALSVLVFRGPLTLGELARAEGVRSATMTGIVRGLETAGLARRTAHAHDGRAVLVRATPRGRRLLMRARRARIGAIAERLGDLSREELAALRRAGELLEERFAPPGLRWQPVGRDLRGS
jgi:DNA-binding MarR family transcriptional regulator